MSSTPGDDDDDGDDDDGSDVSEPASCVAQDSLFHRDDMENDTEYNGNVGALLRKARQ